jgi:hypothetical protein
MILAESCCDGVFPGPNPGVEPCSNNSSVRPRAIERYAQTVTLNQCIIFLFALTILETFAVTATTRQDFDPFMQVHDTVKTTLLQK